MAFSVRADMSIILFYVMVLMSIGRVLSFHLGEDDRPRVVSDSNCTVTNTREDFYEWQINCNISAPNDLIIRVKYLQISVQCKEKDNSNTLRQYFPDIWLPLSSSLLHLKVDNCLNLSYAEVISKMRFGNQSQDGPTQKITVFGTEVSLTEQSMSNMLRVKELNLINSNIRLIKSRDFSYLPNLTSLLFNYYCRLESEAFSCLHNLQYLEFGGSSVSQCQYNSIPENLFDNNTMLIYIKILNNMQLKTLPQKLFSNLIQLKELYLNDNGLEQLPANLFSSCTKLSFIGISNNIKLKILPESLFGNLIHLFSLQMNGNGLEHLASDLFRNCTSLFQIRVSNNIQLKTLPGNLFSDLSNLQYLELNGNGLEQLPANLFRNCTKLYKIEISNNIQLKTLSENLFSNLTHLRALKLNGNGLEHLPSKLFLNCPRLYEIELSKNNKLKTLPESLFNDLPFLSKLQVNDNGLEQLPANLFSTHLYRIELSNNTQLKNLPDSLFSKLIRLAELYLNGNGLEQVPANLFRYCTHLHTIELSNNSQLKTLPDSLLSYLTYLSNLELNGNGLEQLPSNLFRNCTNLNTIQLSSNNLISLPENIFTEVTALTDLNLGNNRIPSLPRNLFRHQRKLKSVDLSFNRLQNIEPALEILWKHNELSALYLNNNQMNISVKLLKLIEENEGSMKRLSIEGNTLKCDCKNLNDLVQIRFVDGKFVNLDPLPCEDDATRRTYKDAIANIKSICDNSDFFITVGVVVFTPILLMLAAIALYYKYQTNVKVFLYARGCCLRWITEEELDKDKKYDVFISFSHKDEQFVHNELVSRIEGPPHHYKACVYYRDWLAGKTLNEQIAESIENSKRTILVLTPDFLKSEWSRFEFRLAHYNSLKEGRMRLIAVIYKDISDVEEIDRELNAYLQTNTYVKWGDPWFWEKLNYALPHSSSVNAPNLTEDIEMVQV